MVLAQLVKREIKAFLKNPAFIISIVILVAFYGAIGSIARRGIEEATQAVLALNIGVVLEEDTSLTREIVRILNEKTNSRVLLYSDIRSAVEKAGIGIVIAKGFTENATNPYIPLFVEGLVRIEITSQIGIQAKLGLLSYIRDLLKYAVSEAIKNIYGEELYREKVVYVHGRALFYGHEVDSDLLLGFISIVSLLPLFVGIVVGSNATYASQIVALEKVEKAFELLLSQPIKRSRIVLAKIIGASIASMIFASAYVAGLVLMGMGFFFAIPQEQFVSSGGDGIANAIEALSKAFGVDILQLLLFSMGITLLLGLYSSGALGIILGSLSPDERTAGILTTPVMLIYFGVAFMMLFTSIEPNIALAVISGIVVLSIPTIYILSSVIGQPVYGLISIAIALAFSMILTLIATYVFNRDIVILGVRLRLRKTGQS